MLVPMNRRIYIILAFGLLGVSFGAPLARFVPEMAALTIAFWRMAGASTLLWGHGAISAQGALGKNKFPLVLIAGIFLALHFACFYSAVKMAPIANATLFATLAPVFTLIYERVFLKRKLSSGALIGLLLAIAGAVVVHGSSLQFDAAETKGNLMALISSVFMSVVLIMGERIRGNTGNILYTRWLYLFAAITLAIIGVFGGIDLTFSWPDSRWILALVVLPTLIGHNSMSYAVKYLRPTIVGSMPFGEPILATILAWVLFGEGIGWPIILGGSITLTGLVILTFYRK